MITLNQINIKNPAPLSNRFQLALKLINGGESWLQWAIQDSKYSYAADNEEQLLRIIQQGLHSEEYIYFQTFRASIKTLLGMSDDSLKELVQAHAQVQDEGKSLERIFSQYELLPYEELAKVKAFQEEKKLNSHPLFKAISFEDQIVLHRLLDQMTEVTEKHQGEAIDFGLQMAASVTEFSHYYQFYLITVQNHLPKETADELRMKEVIAIYEKLFPLANYLIHTPNLGAEVSDHELPALLPDFLKQYKRTGYNTKSAAMLNLAENILLKDKEVGEIESQIEGYLQDVHSLVVQEKFPSPRISQDGRFRTFEIPHDKGGLTKLMIDYDGNVSLLPGTLKIP